MSDFTPYQVLLELGSNDTYGVFLMCWIKSKSDEEKCASLISSGARLAQKGAPLRSGRLRKMHWRKAAPLALLDRRKQGAFSLAAPPKRHEWRAPESEKEKLENELSELREVISETAIAIDGYDRLLKPYWADYGYVTDAVRDTHGRGENNGLVFNPAGAADRKPMFDALVDLALEYGATKNERAELRTRLKGYEREAKAIMTQLKWMADRKRKAQRG